MQINVNTIMNAGESGTGIYKVNEQQETGSIFDVRVSDEYKIQSAENLTDNPVLTRQGSEEKDPLALAMEQLNQLAESIGISDFDKYEELGLIPEQDELGRVVTVSERIKIELAMYCENYTGDISNISMEMLTQMYGSSGMAYAAKQQMRYMDMARELSNMDGSTKAYLLKNDMEPTIENVYLAQHSGSVSYNAESLSDSEWEELKPQVKAILEKVGLGQEEELLAEGRFLIEQGIALTPENILKSKDMNVDIEGRTEEQWMADMMQTIALGMGYADTLVTGRIPDTQQVDDMIQAVADAGEETIRDIMESQRTITILNLKQPPTIEEVKEKIAEDRILAQKEKLKEIYQKMSYEAMCSMMKRGIRVEVLSIEELAVQIDEYENQQARIFLGEASQEKVDLFRQTLNAMEQMREVPSAVLGKVMAREIAFTVQEVTQTGIEMRTQERYAQAEKLYEAVGTEVRGDLGDSIQDAFSSSYGVLEELGIPETEGSRRAVRILGYNQMEITKESVLQIQALDEQVGKMFRNFTPATVAYIIEHNINPLETEINTLNENLVALNQEMGFAEEESYSKYLWKLDKAKGISKEDRAAYVGLYKLIHKVEKGDRRAIGAVLKSGGEMNLKNLYHAWRNLEAAGKEVQVDDDLGLTEQVNVNENNLSEQLGIYEKMYDGMLDKVWRYTTPEQVSRVGVEQFQDMNLEELAATLKQEPEDEEYSQMRAEDIWQARFVSEENIEMLMNADTTVSISNLMAASYFKSSPNGIWGKLKKDNEELEKKFEDIDMEDLEDSYPQKVEEALETVREQAKEKSSPEFKMFHRAIRLLGAMAKKQSYFIPMDLQGETSTVRLTIVAGAEEKGKVSIDIYSETYGQISAQLRRTEDGIRGTVLAHTREGLELAGRAAEGMEPEYGNVKVEKALAGHIAEGVFGNAARTPAAGEKTATNAQLYQIAKSFLANIKENEVLSDK